MLSAPIEVSCTTNGNDNELLILNRSASVAKVGNRPSDAKSSTRTTSPDRAACKHGPSALEYCAPSSCNVVPSVAAVVVTRSLVSNDTPQWLAPGTAAQVRS